MTVEERKRIYSNDYIGIIIDYNRKDKFMKKFEGDLLIKVDDKNGVIYFPVANLTQSLEWENEYAYIPKIYGLLDSVNLDAMGVGKVQEIPRLGLMGEGVILGFLDTGIDYTNPIFKNANGTTRIISIWDQTVENLDASENIFYYGTEYKGEQINSALQSDDPYSVVPSIDEIGHGTMLAGLAGGSRDEENDFRGVVPLSEFAVVKLRQAKQNLREHLFIPENVPGYAQDDIMFATQYLINLSLQLNKPIVICIGLGTSQGPHDVDSLISDFMSFHINRVGIAFIVAAGNEGNSKAHYYGVIDRDIGHNEVELKVGAGEKGFSMEIWGSAPNNYLIDILSPSGQYVTPIQVKLGESRVINFIFENTIVYVDYVLVESQTGSPLILVRFDNPAEGIWKFNVYGRGSGDLSFNIWLPITGFISPETFFLNSDPDITVTEPGDTFTATTVTAYNVSREAIYINASRGYTRTGLIKPNLAAPGVDVLAPVPGPKKYITVSGTSMAAAYTAGLAAMLFEWGIVRGNYETMGSLEIQRFLLRGVERSASLEYPNRIWGYGIVNIYNTFLSLSSGML